MLVFLTKFLFHFRESQSKWFAKRGINWHISVGSYIKNGVINSHTVVHLFDEHHLVNLHCIMSIIACFHC